MLLLVLCFRRDETANRSDEAALMVRGVIILSGREIRLLERNKNISKSNYCT